MVSLSLPPKSIHGSKKAEAGCQDSSRRIKAHAAFAVIAPDEVAECWTGVTEVDGLYGALWELVDRYPKRRSEWNDDFDARCVKKFWRFLSREHQAALNALAASNDREG